MEEHILKIIEGHLKLAHDGSDIYYANEKASKEIAETFERFINYCIDNVTYDNRPEFKYLYSINTSDATGYKLFKNIDELFTYWFEHINETQHS
jgi:hypothetical protein